MVDVYFNDGLWGAVFAVFILLSLNFLLGAASTNEEVKSVCAFHGKYSDENVKVLKFGGVDFCINMWPLNFQENPIYLGQINCETKTFFWESKECYLQEKEK